MDGVFTFICFICQRLNNLLPLYRLLLLLQSLAAQYCGHVTSLHKYFAYSPRGMAYKNDYRSTSNILKFKHTSLPCTSCRHEM